jgi:hypothetical protein
VKRYKSEEGTAFVDYLMEVLILEKHVIATSALTMIELVSVLKRAEKGRILSKKDISMAMAAFSRDCERLTIRTIGEGTMEKALDVILDHGTRTLDSIHLGSLIEFRDTMRLVQEDVILLSDDLEMCSAARKEKFQVITSNDFDKLKRFSEGKSPHQHENEERE